MQRTHRRGPSTTWRSFLRQHGSEIWACDFFCIRTITFRMLYVFFVIHHASRQVVHIHVTPNPTASWTAQQMVECCGWDRKPPRFLIHDRDSCYGGTFDRRVRNIGIAQIRTPFRSPRANAIAERWVRSVRTECLDHVFIFNERHLQKILAEYVGYLMTGARIDRWHNGRPAHRGQMRLIGAVKLERSPQYPCSKAYITFISKPHDDDAALILAPYRGNALNY